MSTNLIEDRNDLKTKFQCIFCKVEMTEDNIEKINKIAIFMDIRELIQSIDKVRSSDVYLILGGGVRYVLNRSDIGPLRVEKDIDEVLDEIDLCSK